MTLFGVALLGALPATSSAGRAQPPVVLGKWEAPGFGVIDVRSVGSYFRGTIVSSDPDSICILPPGREVWRMLNNPITGPPNVWRYDGSLYWSYIDPCRPAGFGAARWTFANPPDSGQYCSTPPNGGAQSCDQFTRVGSGPKPLSPYSISPQSVACMSNLDYISDYGNLCNQLYFTPRPGQLRTEIILCTEFTTGFSWVYGRLPVCPDTVGQTGLEARRNGDFRKPRKKVKVLKVASKSMKFSKPGYKGFDLKPTKRARRILRKSAKHHKKLPLTVVSTFKTSSGKTITRRKHFAIKP